MTLNEKRVAYFVKRYSMSLRKFEGGINENNGNADRQIAYLCPLCLKAAVIIVDGVVQHESEFTLDHYPPESVGGNQTVLACKDCNGNAGKDIDYVLKNWLEDQAVVNNIPGSRIPISFAFKDTPGYYKGVIKRDGTEKIDFLDLTNTLFSIRGWMIYQKVVWLLKKLDFFRLRIRVYLERF
jgi:hypothetical protein